MTDLEARIARLEAIDEIRQLAAKYAVALDMRDFDALANLFVDDIGVPGKGRGRAAMREWYDAQIRCSLLGSAHGVLGHVIDVQRDRVGVDVVADPPTLVEVKRLEIEVGEDERDEEEGDRAAKHA